MNAQVIALANQKGGITKTTSCVKLVVGLAQAGKSALTEGKRNSDSATDFD